MKNKTEKKTILIVDDGESERYSIGFSLKVQGLSVLLASNGLEALNIFKKNRPDLIITDLMMPGMTGFELITEIRKEDSSIPIIVLSCIDGQRYIINAFERGANDYFIKPMDIKILSERIDSFLQMSKQQRETEYYKNYNRFLVEENKQLKDQLESASQKQETGLIQKKINDFKTNWGAIAHGLKNEFINMNYSVKEIRADSSVSEEVIEESNVLERSLAYSRLLVQRLFNYLDMGAPQKEPITIFTLLKSFEELAKPRLPSNIQLEIQLPPDLEMLVINANLDQLIGVLLEFIHNSSNALRLKGGNIIIVAERENGNLAISLTDNGPGIPGNIKEQLFKEQISSQNGLGLGLYLSSRIINQFAGTVSVQSEINKGTTFKITFPLTEENKES